MLSSWRAATECVDDNNGGYNIDHYTGNHYYYAGDYNGNNCSYYDSRPSDCGYYDHNPTPQFWNVKESFSASLQCCACGGGCSSSDLFEFRYQAGRCYPLSGAPYLNTGGGGMQGWPVNIYEEGSPQRCYDECVGDSDYMGVELRLTSSSPTGHTCICNRPRV